MQRAVDRVAPFGVALTKLHALLEGQDKVKSSMSANCLLGIVDQFKQARKQALTPRQRTDWPGLKHSRLLSRMGRRERKE